MLIFFFGENVKPESIVKAVLEGEKEGKKMKEVRGKTEPKLTTNFHIF